MQDFRDILKAEFTRRAATKFGYTQSDFARDIKMRPNRLSEVFSGKHGLSESWAHQITERLSMSPHEAQLFIDLVKSKHARSKRSRLAAQKQVEQTLRVNKKLALTEDVFNIVSDWYHFAILELITLKDFEFDLQWMCQRLNINRYTIEMALSRLERLQFIRIEGNNITILKPETFAEYDVPASSVQSFHQQISQLAAAAIQEQDIPERHFESYIVAIDSQHIEEYRQTIKKFMQEINEQFAAADCKDEVYAISTQFFRLTRTNHAES